MMKKITLLVALMVCFSWSAIAQTQNVTFSVDMNNYSGTFTTVNINGIFNGWCGACNPLADSDGDGVWEVTLPLNANDSTEYKFTIDGWIGQENLTPGSSCTKTVGPYTNRFIAWSGDTTLPTVCYESCASCAPVSMGDSVNVTFSVNAALVTTDAAGLFLAGGGTFGNPGDNPMADPDGDDVWEITVRLPKGMTTYYTFTNGNCPSWGCKENIAGLPCADPNNFNDRFLSGAWSDTTVLACFQACESDGTCPSPNPQINVTFQVDMNGQTVDPAGMFIGGSFEGWNGTTAMTDSDADGIWETTLMLDGGTQIEWKYLNGGWTGAEVFDSTHADCTLTTGSYINRVATLSSSDTTLPIFIFNSCDITVSTKPVFTQDELFNIIPTLVDDKALVTFKHEIAYNDKQLQIVNTMGQVVFSKALGQTPQYQLNTSNLSNGIYFVVVQAKGFAQTERIMIQH